MQGQVRGRPHAASHMRSNRIDWRSCSRRNCFKHSMWHSLPALARDGPPTVSRKNAHTGPAPMQHASRIPATRKELAAKLPDDRTMP